MKKFLAIAVLSVAMVAAGLNEAAAQVRFGVIGGATFSKLNKEVLQAKNMTQWNAGVTMQVKLPAGFSIQPSLIYNVKGSKFGSTDAADAATADVKVGYLELPVSVQWGPDLLLFRPFLDVTPYVGYGLNNKMSISSLTSDVKDAWDGMNRWEYGIGLGVGLEIWKIQVIGRYNWNLGSLYDLKAADSAWDAVSGTIGRAKLGGFTLTAAILF